MTLRVVRFAGAMRPLFRVLMLVAVWSLAPPPARAVCSDNTMLNPITDIVWDCIFPITIMGIPLDMGNHPPDSNDSSMFCECPGEGIVGFGFMVGFWEPARMIETTYNAGCFPGLGMELNVSTDSGYSGPGGYALNVKGGQASAFQNYHYYVMPIWAVLDLFSDIPCLSDETTFDLAMVSEVRPDWNDDLYALQLFPEVALMANPAVVMACAADALAATVGRPIDALYWCMGAWETVYPPTGNIHVTDYVKANAGIAGRAMFLQARTALLPDRAVNYCGATPLPLVIKSHWRIQEADPVVDKRCHAIGEPGILWTHRKNPVGKQDNFSWVLFRKVSCCVVLY